MGGVGLPASLAQGGYPTDDAVVALVVFVIVATLGVAVPVVYDFVGGKRARSALDGWKGWLAEHNHAVMAVLCG